MKIVIRPSDGEMLKRRYGLTALQLHRCLSGEVKTLKARRIRVYVLNFLDVLIDQS